MPVFILGHLKIVSTKRSQYNFDEILNNFVSVSETQPFYCLCWWRLKLGECILFYITYSFKNLVVFCFALYPQSSVRKRYGVAFFEKLTIIRIVTLATRHSLEVESNRAAIAPNLNSGAFFRRRFVRELIVCSPLYTGTLGTQGCFIRMTICKFVRETDLTQ